MTCVSELSSVDQMVFRLALGQFASGVTVVTTLGKDGEPQGLTVSSFCSVSLEPPLVLACVDHRSETHAAFARSGLFGVSVLAEHQQDVSQRFAGGGRAKCDGFTFVAGRLGVNLWTLASEAPSPPDRAPGPGRRAADPLGA